MKKKKWLRKVLALLLCFSILQSDIMQISTVLADTEEPDIEVSAENDNTEMPEDGTSKENAETPEADALEENVLEENASGVEESEEEIVDEFPSDAESISTDAESTEPMSPPEISEINGEIMPIAANDPYLTVFWSNGNGFARVHYGTYENGVFQPISVNGIFNNNTVTIGYNDGTGTRVNSTSVGNGANNNYFRSVNLTSLVGNNGKFGNYQYKATYLGEPSQENNHRIHPYLSSRYNMGDNYFSYFENWTMPYNGPYEWHNNELKDAYDQDIYLVYEPIDTSLHVVTDTVTSDVTGLHMYLFDYGHRYDTADEQSRDWYMWRANGDGYINSGSDAYVDTGLGYNTPKGSTQGLYSKDLRTSSYVGFPDYLGTASDRKTISLAPFFDPNYTGNRSAFGGGRIDYMGEVEHLFRKMGGMEDTYYYDSAETAAVYNYDAEPASGKIGTFTLYDERITPTDVLNNYANAGYKRGNFFPFNQIDKNKFYGTDNNKNTNTNSNTLSEPLYGLQGDVNVHFGMYMEGTFYQPEDLNDAPIFYIRGDDDILIYIDDYLVVDLGGIHEPIEGQIDFKTGEVTWQLAGGNPRDEGAKLHDNLKNILYQNGYVYNGANETDKLVDRHFKGNTFAPNTIHTIKVFYDERGEGASNLLVTVNSPTPALSIFNSFWLDESTIENKDGELEETDIFTPFADYNKNSINNARYVLQEVESVESLDNLQFALYNRKDNKLVSNNPTVYENGAYYVFSLPDTSEEARYYVVITDGKNTIKSDYINGDIGEVGITLMSETIDDQNSKAGPAVAIDVKLAHGREVNEKIEEEIEVDGRWAPNWDTSEKQVVGYKHVFEGMDFDKQYQVVQQLYYFEKDENGKYLQEDGRLKRFDANGASMQYAYEFTSVFTDGVPQLKVEGNYKSHRQSSRVITNVFSLLENGDNFLKYPEIIFRNVYFDLNVNKWIQVDDNPENLKKHDDVKVGDIVTYVVETNVLNYAGFPIEDGEEKKINYSFKLIDDPDSGLEIIKNQEIKVQVAGDDGSFVDMIKGEDYEVEYANEGIQITLKDPFRHSMKSVHVIYKAKVVEPSKIIGGYLRNSVYAEYTNDVDNPDDTITSERMHTYVYSFGFNGEKLGESEDDKLAGAVFGLYYPNGDPVYKDSEGKVKLTATSNAQGFFSFTGLDSGTYILKEIKAPSGYALDTTEHTIKIDVQFADEPDQDNDGNPGSNYHDPSDPESKYTRKGRIDSFTVTFDDEDPITYTAVYEDDELTGYNPANMATTPFGRIKNIEAGSLAVNKVVTNEDDPTTEFDFTVTFFYIDIDKSTGEEVEIEVPLNAGVFSYTKKDAEGKWSEPKEFELGAADKGQYSFKLKHNETIKISGLPEGLHYRVEEKEVQGYITSASNNTEGQIEGDETIEVEFTNKKTNTPQKNSNPKHESEVTIGEKITYWITWENYKNSTATVKVTDTLDKGVDFVGAGFTENGIKAYPGEGWSKGKDGEDVIWTYTENGTNNTIVYNETKHTVTWTLQNRNKGETGAVYVAGIVNEQAKDTITNTAKVQVDNDTEVDTNKVEHKVLRGNLAVSKVVEPENTGDEFSFSVKFSYVDDNNVSHWLQEAYEYTVTPARAGATGSETLTAQKAADGSYYYSFTLKHGETLTIKDLPAGVKYEVQEGNGGAVVNGYGVYVNVKADSKSESKVAANPASGNIPEKDTAEAEFHNYTPVKTEVEIDDKKVSVTPEGKSKFVGEAVTVGQTITYRIYWKNFIDDGTTPADVIVTDTLSAGLEYVSSSAYLTKETGAEKIEVEPEQDGQKYTWTLKEQKQGAEGYVELKVLVTEEAVKNDIVNNRATVTVGGKTTETKDVENAVLKGNLSVTKTVVSNAEADKEEEFSFKVKFSYKDAEGKTRWLQEAYGYTVTPARAGATGNETMTAKKAADGSYYYSFTLKHGETITIKDLPAGVDYVVEEEDSNGYKTTYTNNTGKIEANKTAAAEVRNSRPNTPQKNSNPKHESEVTIGEKITYWITWENYKNSTATVKVTDTLDKGVDFVGAGFTENGIKAYPGEGWSKGKDGEDVIWTYTENGTNNTIVYNETKHTVTWTLQNRNKGETGAVYVAGIVNEQAKDTITNTAKVQVDNDTEVDTNKVEHKVLRGNLAVSKVVEPENTGDEFSFSVKFSYVDDNNVSHWLQEAYEYTVTPARAGTTGSEKLTAQKAADGSYYYSFTLKHGETLTIKDLPAGVKYEVQEGNGGAVVNGYGVYVNVKADSKSESKVAANPASGDIPEKDTAEAEFHNYTPVKTEVEIDDKKVSVTPEGKSKFVGEAVTVGQTITYRIYWKNFIDDGTTPVDVIITDTLSAGLEYVSSSAYLTKETGAEKIEVEPEQDGQKYTWTLKEQKQGAEGYVELKVLVTEEAVKNDIVNNRATVTVGGKTTETKDVENAVLKGNLAVSKVVEPENTGDEFSFSVKFSYEDAEGKTRWLQEAYGYTVTPARAGATGSEKLTAQKAADGSYYYSFTLKHRETIKIKDLPAGVKYEVQEGNGGAVVDGYGVYVNVKADSESESKVAANPASGKIPEKETAEAEFHNYTPVKTEVEIDDKEVSVTPEGESKFVGEAVTVGQTITYRIYWKNFSDDGNTPVDVIITDTLSAGLEYVSSSAYLTKETGAEKIEVEPEQDGQKYTWTLKEQKQGAEGYVELKVLVTEEAVKNDIVNNRATVTVDGKTTATKDVENAVLKGNLSVTKTVVSDAEADKEEEFSFSVKFSYKDAEGKTRWLQEAYEYTVEPARAGATGSEMLTAQKAADGSYYYSFTLKHGETITIKDLPAGVDYVVEEEDSDGYKTTVGTSSTNTASDVITANSTDAVSFTNTRADDPEKDSDPKAGTMRKVGDEITYTITWENYKNRNADVTILDELIQGLDYKENSAKAYRYNAETETYEEIGIGICEGNAVKWELKQQPGRSYGYVELIAIVNEDAAKDEFGNEVINDALVKVGEDTAVRTNKIKHPVSNPEKTEVTPGAGKVVLTGSEITYEITWENYMETEADVIITDPLDVGVDFIKAKFDAVDEEGEWYTGDNEVEGISYDAEAHTVTWTLENQAAKTAGRVTLVVRVKETATIAGIVDNQASVKVGSDDPVDTDIVENPTPKTGIVIHKEQSVADGKRTDEKQQVKNGDEVTYYLTVTNVGAIALNDVIVTDAIPEGLSLVSGSISNNGTVSGGVITWKLGTLDVDETVTLSFKVKVPGVDKGTTWFNIAKESHENPEDPSKPRFEQSSNEVIIEEVPVTPDTGDHHDYQSWLVLLAVSFLAVAVLVTLRKRLNKQN